MAKVYQRPGKTIYISNLRYNFDEKGLDHLFSKFGKVAYIKIMKQPGTDRPNGAAFAHMEKGADADRAINYLNGKEVGGRTLSLSVAKEQKESPVVKNAKKALITKARGDNKKEIILKKKARRSRGLRDLLAPRK